MHPDQIKMTDIIPKSKTKGIDFCGTKYFSYIIRSDLGCFMQASDFHNGSDLTISCLHPSCQNGDHYLGSQEGYFYIIKGDAYRKVTNLTNDSNAEVYNLHPNCQGGDHYLAGIGYIYIIFQEKGTYRKTTNISLDSDSEDFTLHPNCRDGIYYWGLPYHCYFLKPASKWGVEYYKGTNFNRDDCFATYSVHPDVLNFLPGGLSIVKGPATGVWENIKTIVNDSNTPIQWQKKICKRVGYEKEKMSQIEHNWKISMSASCKTGALTTALVKFQFSLSLEYGGLHVNSEKENWSEATEVEEEISVKLKPKESVYVWQHKLSLGQESVLFCRDMRITNEPNPPEIIADNKTEL